MRSLLCNRSTRAAMLSVDAPHVITACMVLPTLQPVLPPCGPRFGKSNRILRRQAGGEQDGGSGQIGNAEMIADQETGLRGVLRNEIQRRPGQCAASSSAFCADSHIEPHYHADGRKGAHIQLL